MHEEKRKEMRSVEMRDNMRQDVAESAMVFEG